MTHRQFTESEILTSLLHFDDDVRTELPKPQRKQHNRMAVAELYMGGMYLVEENLRLGEGFEALGIHSPYLPLRTRRVCHSLDFYYFPPELCEPISPPKIAIFVYV